mmetsp:Transcript_9519/g.10523  ORF Transcript_9519/g.10523 Transcript_9519/m.10523 type:complete len:333 (+) Transcript_9519:291-1289(+)
MKSLSIALLAVVTLSAVFSIVVEEQPNASPVVVTYIDKINGWWPPATIAAGIGVPGYAKDTSYNVFNIAFWLSSGPTDIADIWADPLHYFSAQNPFGSTSAEIQANLTSMYHAAGKKIMISAFGATEFPTSGGKDAVKTCTDLANFVKTNQLDGVDLDYEDNAAMNSGAGVQWLIDCTTAIRKVLPVGQYILSHAPQAPYFMGEPKYPKGGYLEVDKQVGHLIDYYNVQFYNQDQSSYDTLESLFINSNGWATNSSIQQMINNGIPGSRIVIGKPVTTGDASNTGWVAASALQGIIKQGKQQVPQWTSPGVMTWQYSSDKEGSFIDAVAQAL